ncbi:hypothetical protein Taro_035053 [Colocasia esculenta]|uniref:Uncharacterized protein n=1 Tax=Colocasia esculenta TaxID=4460 RepID=A0A843W4M5_COLES|nr:hypothetical protein [Colocasia esculenta]
MGSGERPFRVQEVGEAFTHSPCRSDSFGAVGGHPPMVAMPCFRRQQLCCACRAEKLAFRSLDAGASAGVHVWTLTLAQRPGLDAKIIALIQL